MTTGRCYSRAIWGKDSVEPISGCDIFFVDGLDGALNLLKWCRLIVWRTGNVPWGDKAALGYESRPQAQAMLVLPLGLKGRRRNACGIKGIQYFLIAGGLYLVTALWKTGGEVTVYTELN